MNYDQNKLLDNSNEQLSLRPLLRALIPNSECSKIQIATGYWAMPGTNLLIEELKHFLESALDAFAFFLKVDRAIH